MMRSRVKKKKVWVVSCANKPRCSHANGNLLSVADAKGQATTYTYDSMDQGQKNGVRLD